MDVLFKLLLVHLVADFLLQWPAMLNSKVKLKFKSPYLYIHGVIHGVLSALILFDLSWLLPIVIITVTHIVIDGLKLTLTTQSNERFLFFVDQLLHLIVLVGLWAYQTGYSIDILTVYPHFWAHAMCLFFITFPASIFIQKIFLKWPLPERAGESLRGVGAQIGYIERILIYIAVVTQHWVLVGFLIAAKSIFRLGDFSNSDDRAYAEYIFVGTMLSMFMAIMAGITFLLFTGQKI